MVGTTWILLTYLTLTGLAAGSFVGLVADRVPRGESIVALRSACSTCGRVLAWWELVPVLSYLALRGRCYGCGARIPVRLVFVEIGTGFFFLTTGVRYGVSVESGVVVLFLSLLTAVSLIDLERRLILNKLVYPMAVVSLLLAPLTPWAPPNPIEAWGRSVVGGGIGFALMLMVYLASRGGMGAGDVKFAGVIGLMTGLVGVVVALFAGFVLGGTIALGLLAFRVRGRKDVMPFGPYLALGAAIALFSGSAVLDWYLGLLRWRA